MPLAAPGLFILGQEFYPLFRRENPIEETAEAAAVWAHAYYLYASVGNVVVPPPKEHILAADLAVAFNPELNGGGKGLFLAALAKFWIGVPAAVPPGIVTIFVPSGSIDANVPDDATPQQNAEAIADLVHQLTIASAKVLPTPPGPLVPVS
jgi:hypothetical protein